MAIDQFFFPTSCSLKTRAFSLIILFSLVYISSGMAQPDFRGLPITKAYNTTDYKGGIQNWEIAQDKRGIIYIANNFGLLEFDGTQWNRYAVKNNTKIRCLAIDADGRIYVGAQEEFGYFYPDKKGRLQYFSLADSLSPALRNFGETWDIYLNNNKVYFCTFRNIYEYSNGKIRSLGPDRTIEFTFLIRHTLYVHELDKGLFELKNGSFNLVPQAELLKDKSISSMLSLAEDQVLITTFSGDILLMSNQKIVPWKSSISNLLKKTLINCAIRLRNGNLALGTQNDGVFIIDPAGNLKQHLTKEKGLQNRTILSLYQDKLNNLWVGHNNGLTYVELGSPFTLIDEKIELPGTGYAASIYKNELYLGTNTGLYRSRFSNDGQLSFLPVENTAGQVYHISNINNSLLVGHHNGAFQVKENSVSQISDVVGAWMFLPLNNEMDNMLEGTYNGLLLLEKQNEVWKQKNKISGFNESSRVMVRTEDNTIWMSHGYKGVYRLKLNEQLDSLVQIDFYNSEDGFPSDILINVFQINNQLVFTAEKGVYKFDQKNNRFVPHDFFNKLLGDDSHIQIMQEDALGNIYFIGNDKVGTLKVNQFGEYKLEHNVFNKIRNLLNDDLENLTILDNNNILFGAKEGFIHYNPTFSEAVQDTFEVLIRDVTTSSGSDSLLFAGNFTDKNKVVSFQPASFIPNLPYVNNSVRFSFSAPYYDGVDNIQYQFFLENFDAGWSDWTNQTFKEYTNLPEGKYIFKVRAKNIYGQLSNEAVYSLAIAAPWYRSNVAYTSYFVGMLSIILFAVMVVDRKHRKEKHLMEIQQQQALTEKDSELHHITKKSEEEITKLRTEKLKSEIQYKNKELASATMHLINKNEFISSIRNNLNVIIKKNESSKSFGKDLHRIIKDIEQNIDSDKDWKQFEMHFDQVHGDFSKRIVEAFPDLTPQELKLCAYLRLNLSTKEIAQLLNISVRGVEIARYRLRKKLNLDRQDNLAEFILKF